MNQMATQSLAITVRDVEPEVGQSDTQVLGAFRAECCAPCRAPGPVIESLATNCGGAAVCRSLAP